MKTILYIDYREFHSTGMNKGAMIQQYFEALGYIVIVQQLDIADYIIEKDGFRYYIELKDGNDLFMSMKDNRLSKQLTDLSEQEYALLVYLGDAQVTDIQKVLPSITTRKHVVRTITSVACKRVRDRVSYPNFLQLDDLLDFIDALEYIMECVESDKFYRVPMEAYPLKKAKTLDMMKINMLTVINNVTDIKAKECLEFVNYDLYALKTIKPGDIGGIGKTTIEWFKKLFP